MRDQISGISLDEEAANLVTAARTGNGADLGVGLDALGRALERATLAQTRIGTGFGMLDEVRAAFRIERAGVNAELSSTEDADMVSAITNMTEADTAYRAALAAFGRIGTVSLMDYLQ